MDSFLEAVEERIARVFSVRGTGETLVSELPERLEILEAHKYPLVGGGKRVRALALGLMAEAVGGKGAGLFSLTPAVALECIHTYSLVHDDLPSMDNDDLRRGKATTHKVFGEAKALLVGDGLLTKAFELLGMMSFENVDRPHIADLIVELVCVFSRACGVDGMVYGQWLDLSYTSQEKEVGWEIVRDIEINKTGRLLSAALEGGLLCGLFFTQQDSFVPRSEKILAIRSLAREIGLSVGVAFQITDDILDSSESASVLGKTPGKDLSSGKPTIVGVVGIEKARALAEKYSQKASSSLKALFANPQFSAGAGSGEAISSLISLIDRLLCRRS